MITDPQRLSLLNLIDTNVDLTELVTKPKDLLSALNLANISRENHELQSAKQLPIVFGVEAATQIIGAFKAIAAQNPLFDSMYIALSTVGLDFSHPIIQGSIDSLVQAGVFSADQGASIKGLGIWQVSLATMHFQQDVTQEDVDAVIILYARRQLQRQVAERYNAVVTAVEAGEVVSWEEARAMMGGE